MTPGATDIRARRQSPPEPGNASEPRKSLSVRVNAREAGGPGRGIFAGVLRSRVSTREAPPILPSRGDGRQWALGRLPSPAGSFFAGIRRLLRAGRALSGAVSSGGIGPYFRLLREVSATDSSALRTVAALGKSIPFGPAACPRVPRAASPCPHSANRGLTWLPGDLLAWGEIRLHCTGRTGVQQIEKNFYRARRRHRLRTAFRQQRRVL